MQAQIRDLEEQHMEFELNHLLHIAPGLDIASSELSFRFSRSSGPGGQHVNRSATRVELLFDVAGSPSLSDEVRARLLTRLTSHLDSTGVLHLVSQSTRSQLRNREELVERFRMLLSGAMIERRKRHPTRPTLGSREERLRSKRRRGEIKRGRHDRDAE
jgi:ribosome-associated protein